MQTRIMYSKIGSNRDKDKMVSKSEFSLHTLGSRHQGIHAPVPRDYETSGACICQSFGTFFKCGSKFASQRGSIFY